MYVPEHLKLIETPDKGLAVIAGRDILKNESVCEILYESIALPREITANTAIQIQENGFFGMEKQPSIDDFINHSCDPNTVAYFSRSAFVAIRFIRKGEGITYNYLTTEADLVIDGLDFDCKCGSEKCRGRIKGFDFLAPEQQMELWTQYLATHLRIKLLKKQGLDPGIPEDGILRKK